MPKVLTALALVAALSLSACATAPQSMNCCASMKCCSGKMDCCKDKKGCCCCNGDNVKGCPYNYKK